MKLRTVVLLVALAVLPTACGNSADSGAAKARSPGVAQSDDPIVATPSDVAPGELVELTFPTELSRGAPWYLSKWRDTAWSEPLYLVVASQRNGYNSDGPDWRVVSDDCCGWDDIGFGGPGPDIVVVPDTADPGDYRFCTANAADGTYCVNVAVGPPS